jgi:hypothetical protein
MLALVICIVVYRSDASWPVWVALLISPIFIAVGASTNNLWNTGMAVFSRYTYYACAPWIVLLASYFATPVHGHYRAALAGVFVVGQLGVVATFGIFGWGQFARVRTAGSAFAFDNFPSYYNPIPNTFAERSKVPYEYTTVAIWVRDGSATKIMFNERFADVGRVLQLVCGSARPRYSLYAAEDRFRYINMRDGCPTDRPNGMSFVKID